MEGLDAAVFTGHDFKGDQDFSQDGLYLTVPDYAEASFKFQLPKQLTSQSIKSQFSMILETHWVQDLTEDSVFLVYFDDDQIECYDYVDTKASSSGEPRRCHAVDLPV